LEFLLKRVESDADWRAYHQIRRRVLWHDRGFDGYDEQHADDRKTQNHPLLLMHRGEPVGTARLDVASPVLGIVRLVAIRPELQRRGMGTALMREVEKYALRLGLDRLEVNAAKDAKSFYHRLGWTVVASDRKNPLMSKELEMGTSRT
jgi:N-acetylglutamate synthase-like GNAT family acetyltransferase